MNKRHVFLILVSGFLTLASASLFGTENESSVKRALILDDFGSFSVPELPRISPQGDRIAYVLDDQIHVVSTDGGEPRSLTSSSSAAWQPRWSADGNSLYFLSDRDESTQLWKLPVRDFGEAIKITDFVPGITSINLSPDESKLLLELLNAELFYQALKVRGIESQLVVYPGMHHGDWSEEFDKDYIRRIVDWFDKYLANE